MAGPVIGFHHVPCGARVRRRWPLVALGCEWRVVSDLVGPAAPDDADPGPGQDPDRVGVASAAGRSAVVDGLGPGTALAAAIGEVDQRLAEAGGCSRCGTRPDGCVPRRG